jgi:hypothetical protein
MWPKISSRKINGNTYYTIDCGMVDGKRKILTRADKKDAMQTAERIRRRRARIGKDALRLSEPQLRDAAEALAKLGRDHSLREAVDFDRGDIYVTGEISKPGYERYIQMQPNLIEWLLPYRGRQGPVFYAHRAYQGKPLCLRCFLFRQPG